LKFKGYAFKIAFYLLAIVLPAIASAAAVSGEAQDVPLWRKVLDFINEHTFWSAAIFLILTTVITTIFSLIRKDKCLKKLRGKFVTLQLRNGQFYKGIFRLEATGIEIVSEKSRVEGKEASFLLSGKWKDQVHAFVRYHDVMLEREKQERDNELEKVYHPRFAVRLRRKIKVALNTLKNALNQILMKVIGEVKSRFKAVEAQKFIEETSREALEYSVETVYDRLIDRLVGTKVVVAANKQEYEGVLADYTNEWIELMEVNYKDYWEVQMKTGDTLYRDPHGLRIERHGDRLVIENHGPFTVQLQKLWYLNKQPNQEHKLYKNIEPFGEMELRLKPSNIARVVSPFEDVRVSVPVSFNQYEFIKLSFETHRMADVTMPRGYASIRHRSEKYEPKLLSLSTLTDIILSETPKDFLLTDKKGRPLKYINIHHGYVTNLEKDRMDVKEAAQAYAHRWEVERLFDDADSKLRPFGRLFNNGTSRLSPRSGALIAQMAMLKMLSLDSTLRRPKPQLLYFPLAFAGKGRYRGRTIGMPVKVLVLTGNMRDLEFPALQKVKAVGNRKIILERTNDKKLPRLDKSHILWISYAEISDERYQFNYDIEKRLKSFVANGGVVIAMGQKSRPKRSCRTTWLPEPIVGKKSDQIQEFDPTSKAGNLFQRPNRIKSGHLAIGDPWVKWSDNYELLATVKLDGKDAAAALKLEYGDGMFIVTALKNETPDNIKLNAPMMENLIHYAVEWINKKQETLKKERRWVA
jgi:hypothetical protein